MATEGHRKKSKAEKLVEWDEEETRKLYELKADIEKLELRMRQEKETKLRWVYEWPMKKPKVKWPVRELMVKGQQRLLKRWLRYAENLKATEEKMICHCWPETGRGLDDWDDEEFELGSSEDLIDCQEGSGRFPNGQMGKGTEMRSADDLKDCQEGREGEITVFHEGNELRSAEDLTYCHEDSQGNSHCQLGNERRSDEDLEDCQEGSHRRLPGGQ
jgi:hypothetical protein